MIPKKSLFWCAKLRDADIELRQDFCACTQKAAHSG